MPRSAKPAAPVSMKGCDIPAPAPCASTKQARALRGRSSSAETDVALSTCSFRLRVMSRCPVRWQDYRAPYGPVNPRRIICEMQDFPHGVIFNRHPRSQFELPDAGCNQGVAGLGPVTGPARQRAADAMLDNRDLALDRRVGPP